MIRATFALALLLAVLAYGATEPLRHAAATLIGVMQ